MPELMWDVFKFDFCHLCEFSNIALLKSGASKLWPLCQSFLSPVFVQPLNKNSFYIIKWVKKIKGSMFLGHVKSIKFTLPCLCLKFLKPSHGYSFQASDRLLQLRVERGICGLEPTACSVSSLDAATVTYACTAFMLQRQNSVLWQRLWPSNSILKI